jgi:hypothetical protein
MPTQVTTTQGANVQAMVQKSQARVLPRTPRAERAGHEAGAASAQPSTTAQDFRTLLRRMDARRTDTQRM